MSRAKFSPEIKLQAVKKYLSGKGSLPTISQAVGIDPSTLEEWIMRYKSEGTSCFFTTGKNKAYSQELKLQAVEAYLSGKGSLKTICEKYQISSTRVLRQWIKKYNSHEEFKTRRSGGIHMTKGRKTTQQERLEAVKYCLENGNDYNLAAEKFQVSYQQVYLWTKKFSEMGEAGLEDRRGQRTMQQTPRTKEEELQEEIAKLKHELYMTQIERDLLKKLQEFERGDL